MRSNRIFPRKQDIFFLDSRGQRTRPTISFTYHCGHTTRGVWCPFTEEGCLFNLKAPCNSHLSAWSLLPLFCTWFYLLKQSIPFVSFCVFILVLTESSDKYHPYTSVKVLVSVVSSTTHTSLCDLFVLSIMCQKCLPTTNVFNYISTPAFCPLLLLRVLKNYLQQSTQDHFSHVILIDLLKPFTYPLPLTPNFAHISFRGFI